MIRIGKYELSQENIFKFITSYDIFAKYSNNFKKIGKNFYSDFRCENNPSCQINYINGDLLYTDFGLGRSFRAIQFVMYLYNINYYEALEKINTDFNLNLGNEFKNNHKNTNTEYKVINNDVKKFVEKKPSIIKIKSRSFEQHDLVYWNKFGIKTDTLIKYNICPISCFWINDNYYIASKYSYSYNFGYVDNIFRRKIYQPFENKFKWFSNGGILMQGINILPEKGNLLIITKSLKDVMLLNDIGYNSIAPNSEATVKLDIINNMKTRFKNIIVFYDNDSTGINFSEKICNKYNLKRIFIPKESNCKDISEYSEKYGFEEANKLMNELIKNLKSKEYETIL